MLIILKKNLTLCKDGIYCVLFAPNQKNAGHKVDFIVCRGGFAPNQEIKPLDFAIHHFYKKSNIVDR
ncbi:hypothetical protein CEN48_20645 [Fischerella thermalis CCMEE 5282]|nr:hypothetical protein CEN48_20645 [Fischerella thermalis CCMEE 5282]